MSSQRSGAHTPSYSGIRPHLSNRGPGCLSNSSWRVRGVGGAAPQNQTSHGPEHPHSLQGPSGTAPAPRATWRVAAIDQEGVRHQKAKRGTPRGCLVTTRRQCKSWQVCVAFKDQSSNSEAGEAQNSMSPGAPVLTYLSDRDMKAASVLQGPPTVVSWGRSGQRPEQELQSGLCGLLASVLASRRSSLHGEEGSDQRL